MFNWFKKISHVMAPPSIQNSYELIYMTRVLGSTLKDKGTLHRIYCLLYLMQAHHIAEYNRPLFPERFAPVLESVEGIPGKFLCGKRIYDISIQKVEDMPDHTEKTEKFFEKLDFYQKVMDKYSDMSIHDLTQAVSGLAYKRAYDKKSLCLDKYHEYYNKATSLFDYNIDKAFDYKEMGNEVYITDYDISEEFTGKTL